MGSGAYSGCMNDYHRIEKIIRYLDAHCHQQPDLKSLAELVDLSPSHFHRLFSDWAGITPKAFLKCMTLGHARELLRQGRSTLHAAMESGLSGPGRLHDLCVTLEAASPGEIKSGGSGWVLAVGTADTPFGECVIAESQRGICHLSFLDEPSRQSAMQAVASDWPHADLRWDVLRAESLRDKIFAQGASPPGNRNLKAIVRGTSFQVLVWRALLRIPCGSLVSYGDLALELGDQRSARAVGTAIGQNRLALLIPCHRVIRQTGVLGGYRWGETRKKAMIAWETASGDCARRGVVSGSHKHN